MLVYDNIFRTRCFYTPNPNDISFLLEGEDLNLKAVIF